MNTQEFILKLAEQLGADAKSVVVLVCLVAPCINWIFGITLVAVIANFVTRTIRTVSRCERIVQKLGGPAGVDGLVYHDSEFRKVERYADRLSVGAKE